MRRHLLLAMSLVLLGASSPFIRVASSCEQTPVAACSCCCGGETKSPAPCSEKMSCAVHVPDAVAPATFQGASPILDAEPLVIATADTVASEPAWHAARGAAPPTHGRSGRSFYVNRSDVSPPSLS